MYASDDVNDLCLRSDATAPWTRFLVVAHVECPSDKFEANLLVDELSTGSTIKMLWNGDELDGTTAEILSTLRPRSTFGAPAKPRWRTHQEVTVSRSGGHTLTIEVKRNSHDGAAATVKGWNIVVQRRFSTCMDTQSCLNELDASGSAGRSLRSSNKLLSQCLAMKTNKVNQMNVVGPACATWRRCLRKKGEETVKHMRLLLSAAALKEGAGSSEKADMRAPTCINPPTEDPLGWDCDCFEEMHDRCKALGAKKKSMKWGQMQACVRAHFCLHPNICEPWRAAVCDTKKMKKWTKAIDSLSVLAQQSNRSLGIAFKERANAKGSSGAASDVDGAGKAKRCK
eukprot:gnl/TRDRNA2_/TRDRNA2_176590_c2_seq27.p1 gnl/TRDRNA2_/TRDRNA2_176590_c2~~gnl/TRDRNA2_/TRDRNA2_176590_c2_seq27.p1  ORF type:complete len:341 (-),score=38.41 gnl/TRDRNA2_/TRDRNA2_176590_c2_seq27:210-1232(-)